MMIKMSKILRMSKMIRMGEEQRGKIIRRKRSKKDWGWEEGYNEVEK